MSASLLEQAKQVVTKARKLGAKDVRASISHSRESEVEWRDGQVDRLRESTQMGLNVTLFVDGRYSSNSTNDLRPEALERFLAENIAMTRLLSPDEHRKLPDPARYADRYEGDLGTFDSKGAGSITAAERRKIAQAMENAARSVKGVPTINSVTSSCSDSVYENALVNSNGMEGAWQTSTFILYAETSLQDKDRRPEGYWYEVDRRRDRLPAVEKVGEMATRRAMEGLGQGPVKSGQYKCIVENRVLGRLLDGLQDPISGRAIQQKRSFLADKLNQPVFGAKLTVIDDPHIPGGLGSRPFDYEGMSTRKRPVVEAGVLKSFYLDTYYASKLGMQPTSGGSTNLVFAAGDKDLEGLLQTMERGILITGFIGGNSNSATGDFSYGIRGLWIENGKRVKPVAEMNLSGNHLSFWKRLAETGNDPYTCSSIRCPSMRFDEVQFSGV